MIQNPILSGFHPDPSICRVAGDFYLATSTFEWFPGVALYHSRDLRHWDPLNGALDRRSQLDMRGCENSCGIWAPCLTHNDDRFWLVYTNVRQFSHSTVPDTPNFLVTAEDPRGPWSEPTYLNSAGFDPSLFHDDDGRKYLVQMRTGESGHDRRFNGILLQEFLPAEGRLRGEPRLIWEGSPLGITEGPHLLRREGWYYLLTAEGGTSVRHAVSVCRSRRIDGPYELHPDNPILTSFKQPHLALWSAGHGCLVDTEDGDWFLAHLCQRPLARPGRITADGGRRNRSVPLGRETALQAVRWDKDGWPRLLQGNVPQVMVPTRLPSISSPPPVTRNDFRGPSLPTGFLTLREPPDPSWCRLSEASGALSLRGRDSLASTFDQSLVARRLQHHSAQATTRLRFSPQTYKETAGLISYYDRFHFHYLHLSGCDGVDVSLGVLSSEWGYNVRRELRRFSLSELAEGLCLRFVQNDAELVMAWSLDGQRWEESSIIFEATLCGDWVSPQGGFTGTFWGLCAQDLQNRAQWAQFDYFDYEPHPAEEGESQ